MARKNKRKATSPIPSPAAESTPHTSETADDVPPTEDRASKRPRTDEQSVSNTSATTVSILPSSLTSLPLELLAEILLLTNSPRDVLAVARCSKFLCNTLVNNPSTEFIWKRVRSTCLPIPLPDPTENFTEASYAAFVYDSGACAVCNTHTDHMYASFALRVRLCRSDKCRDQFKSSLVLVGNQSHLWLRRTEDTRCFDYFAINISPYGDVQIGTSATWALSSDHVEYVEDHDALLANTASEECKRRVARMVKIQPKIQAHAKLMLQWRLQYEKANADVKNRNDRFISTFSEREGWKSKDVASCQSYITLRRRKERVLEKLTVYDIESIRPDLEAQLLRMSEARERREYESNYKIRRDDITHHYERLKSGRSQVLPSLCEFRRLPVIKAMQEKTNTKQSLANDLKSSGLIAELIKNDVLKWTESVRNTLMRTLGYQQEWKSASSKRLHPLDRLTARFCCRRCDKVGKRYKMDGCLDFAGVCGHQCPGLSKAELRQYKWSANQFVKDDKAIAVVSELLKQMQVKDDDAASLSIPKTNERNIQCLSCDAFIVLGPQSLIGHAHRHESMKLEWKKDGFDLSFALNSGLVDRLMEKSVTAAKKRALRAYGCRHCLNRCQAEVELSTPDSVMGAGAGGAAGPGVKKRNVTVKVKPLDFNALRSHAKAKHGIEWLRDEDCFLLPGSS